ncbi:MAG: YceI family protein [Magnetococcales bacterium]|nr:YceI family protein [Magnetococcales bacterium]
MKTSQKVKNLIAIALATVLSWAATPAQADNYRIDPTHSFIEFSILHLGISVLKGRFNDISGDFNYDEQNPNSAKISVLVKTASIDSNHAERDKHLRGKDFLNVSKYPEATFTTTSFKGNGKTGTLTGELTIHGKTNKVIIPITYVGAGKDPWGGYRMGFSGNIRIKRSDYGISYNLGPAAQSMDLDLFVEGIKK